MTSETKHSHYVPVFLLSKWQKNINGQNKMTAFSWRSEAKRIVISKKLGPKAYCYVDIYLFSKSLHLKKDFLETKIFSPIDDKAATAIQNLTNFSAEKLGKDMASENVRKLSPSSGPIIAKFILSLMTRHPMIIEKNIKDSSKAIELIKSSPEIKKTFAELDSGMTIEGYLDSIGLDPDKIGLFYSLSHINSKTSIRSLLLKKWKIISLNENVGSFIISDTYIFLQSLPNDSYGCLIMPLSPQHILFISHPHYSIYIGGVDINDLSPKQLLNKINKTFATMAMRYVFSRNEEDIKWLSKILDKCMGYPSVPGFNF